MVGGFVVLAGLEVLGRLVGATPAAAEVTGYAVLGLEQVTLHERSRIEAGNVGVNRGTARLGRRVRVAGTVAADIIDLRPDVVAGSLFCRILEGTPGASCAAFTAPLVGSDQLQFVNVVPGGADVSVPARASTAPLQPGSYGAVTTGPRSLLLLAGRNYAFRSIALAPHSHLLCAGRCRIQVEERVTVGRRASIGPAVSLTAEDVRVDVEGSGMRPAFTAATRSVVTGTVYSPSGAVVLGRRGRYEGAFVGRTVTVGAAAQVRAASGF
jgi:hypothetical protein